MIDRATWLHILAAVAPEANPIGDVVGLILTAVLSTGVITALVTGFVQYTINRRNSRITERKNAVDAESDLVSRYKEAASEERAQKESAVKTIRELLEASEDQVETLKNTVNTLNSTIDLMNKLTNSQADVIAKLTADRDRTQNALEKAEALIETQKKELIMRQGEILELSRGKEDAMRVVRETFGMPTDTIE